MTGGGEPLGRDRRVILSAGMALTFLVFVASLCLGRYPLRISELLGILRGGEDLRGAGQVFWYVRLPRAVLVLVCGASLGLSGTCLQGITRNPLVSPDIIGVSAGASLGAALAIVSIGAGPRAIGLFAFAGGLLAALAAFSLSKVTGGSIVSLVLSGVIISSLAQAGVSLLKYLADPLRQLPALEFWLLGGFHNADWKRLVAILPALGLGALVILLLRWQVNVLSQGEEEASALGLKVQTVKLILVAGSALLVAAVVSVAGIVAWIGLVAPHIARLAVGNDHAYTLPMSLAVGGSLLLAADTLARTVAMAEIPISVVTAFVGAPFLGYLLSKVGGRSWDK